MKALTLTQPWATLVAIGAKRYETRSWYTAYRGPLAIHAAKSFPKWARALCDKEPFGSILWSQNYRWHTLPLGKILATCRLVRCVPTANMPCTLPGNEEAFGDFTIGRYAWELTEVVMLLEPIPTRGMLGLWEWPGSAPG